MINLRFILRLFVNLAPGNPEKSPLKQRQVHRQIGKRTCLEIESKLQTAFCEVQ